MLAKLRSLDDQRYAWVVVIASFLMLLIGNGALFLLVVAMKDIAASFDWPRTIPSTAYSLQFIGGGLGGILMGWWLDKAGMGKPALLGSIMIGIGAVLVSLVESAWQLIVVYGVVIGMLGNAAMFSPLVANITRWFTRHRGMAVGLVTSGQSVAGALWPPVFEYGLGSVGWRDTYLFFGLFGLATMVPLSYLLRRPAPASVRLSGRSAAEHVDEDAPILHIRPRTLLALLCCAIVGCCIAMSLPLAHIKSHATDIGISPMQAATILSMLLAGSFVARAFASGLLIAHVGSLKTLFIFSTIQAVTLGMLPFVEGIGVIYLVAAVFGFGYGGIGPTYPMIVREFLAEQWAGRYTAVVIMFGTFGMAIGGWIGGIGFDMTGAYDVPFLIGVGFNAINLGIVAYLISSTRRRTMVTVPA
ncbi:MAG: MFS transporter [Alphaproteobacteria bacterium]|jgi:MFS family permease|nr:MFS transporter [Rhodospirillaceae bacterium]MBT6511624.1 MFS transporter [Rhodospirillaceae bacterium]MBT7612743.1 MFS transporter [Rhodospirillaceae bacterium]MDG2481695.1 MFS transporter [Alphaproteobacteria bacterium]